MEWLVGLWGKPVSSGMGAEVTVLTKDLEWMLHSETLSHPWSCHHLTPRRKAPAVGTVEGK